MPSDSASSCRVLMPGVVTDSLSNPRSSWARDQRQDHHARAE